MAISEQELLELQIKQKNGIKLTREEKKILKENDKEAREKKLKMSFGERLLQNSKSEYAQLMSQDCEDKYPIRDWIGTGNYLLNSQISGDPHKGMPSGRVWQLSGLSSVGKSYIALDTCKNAQKTHGYFVAILDSEFDKNSKDELAARGIDLEKLIYIPIDTVENAKTTILNLLEEVGPNDKLMIIVDSIGNLSTNKEMDDSIDGATTKDMTRAGQLRALFRTCTMKAGLKNVPIIIVNHVYAAMTGLYAGNVQGGGQGPAYNSSIINEFSKAQEKNADGKMTGALITSTIVKGRLAKEKTKVKFTIDFEQGLTPYSGLLLFCVDEKLLIKSSKTYKLNIAKTGNLQLSIGEEFSPSKINGDFWEEFLEKYLADYLRKKFKYQSVSEELGIDTEEINESEMLEE